MEVLVGVAIIDIISIAILIYILKTIAEPKEQLNVEYRRTQNTTSSGGSPCGGPCGGGPCGGGPCG